MHVGTWWFPYTGPHDRDVCGLGWETDCPECRAVNWAYYCTLTKQETERECMCRLAFKEKLAIPHRDRQTETLTDVMKRERERRRRYGK